MADHVRRALGAPRKYRLCDIPGCGRPHHARGVCSFHRAKPTKVRRTGRKRLPLADRFWRSIEYDTNGGCWLWGWSFSSTGYGQLSVNGVPRTTHVVAWELLRGAIPKDKFVLHRCDVRACCNPDHLFLGTQADNVADMIAKGRNATGFDLPQTKLSVDLANVILEAIAVGDRSQNQIARDLGVGATLVSNVKNGLRRGHHLPTEITNTVSTPVESPFQAMPTPTCVRDVG